jgi:hypothetical protein
MKGRTKFILMGAFLYATLAPNGSRSDDYSLQLLQPRGGDPAPATNPPIVELVIQGGQVSGDSIRLTIDGMSADFDPIFDGIDNDGDGLIDETTEGVISYPDAATTKLFARWPWALAFDVPTTEEVNEGIHHLNVRFTPPVGRDIELEVRFVIYTQGGLDSLIVYPSPFDPAVQNAQIAFRTLIDGAVRIDVLDFQGRTVVDIAHWAPVFAGWHLDPTHFWDGRDGNGDIVGNGVYFLRVSFKAGASTEERIEKCFLVH